MAKRLAELEQMFLAKTIPDPLVVQLDAAWFELTVSVSQTSSGAEYEITLYHQDHTGSSWVPHHDSRFTEILDYLFAEEPDTESPKTRIREANCPYQNIHKRFTPGGCCESCGYTPNG